jgi:D-alanyl-D-alanine carboxypeptidase
MNHPHEAQRLAIAALVSLILLTGCRSIVEEDESLTDTIIPLQAWSAAQTQGKLQPFPPKVTNRLQRLLNRNVGDDRLPGAVLYIATSDGVWMGASGHADRKQRTLIKPIDRFRIADLTEIFVAVACLQLAEEGQIDLTEEISTYLPEDVQAQLGSLKSIQVRQLLNHTSGLPEIDSDLFQQALLENPNRNWTAKELLSYLPSRSEPAARTRFSHSSANYLLLQLILEQVTQNSLAQVLRDRIFTPLKLSNTFVERREPIPEGFVQGYQDWDKDGSIDNVTQPLVNTGLGLGDQGIISNAPDLARFFQALFAGDTLLYPDSLDQMLTLTEDDSGGYGFGIKHLFTKRGEAWGQIGKTTGFSSALLYLPVHDLTIVVWTNSGDRGFDDPFEIAEKSLDIILRESR